MSSKVATFGEIWTRFDLLAAASDEARHEAYQEDGMAFLDMLQRQALINFDNPGINSPEDFSEFIVTLRENYRDWNQYLMGLIAGFDGDVRRTNELLNDFIGTCHWVHLVEAAKNFMDSKP